MEEEYATYGVEETSDEWMSFNFVELPSELEYSHHFAAELPVYEVEEFLKAREDFNEAIEKIHKLMRTAVKKFPWNKQWIS